MSRLDLGVGLVVFPDLLPLLDDLDDLVDVYEVEPQTYWRPAQRERDRWSVDHAAFDTIASRGRPVLAHGVSAPVGGAALPDPATVHRFVRSVEMLGAVAASEHLASNTVVSRGRSIETGVYLPPCPTGAGVARASAAVRTYHAVLDVPFSIETGVNYLRPRRGELTDSEIVARVVAATGCGIVLDLHNLWCNERNGRETVSAALANLPLDRVTEVHLAGGFELDGCYLDAHSAATPDRVLRIAADVLPALSNVRAVVFEILPAHLWRFGLDPLREHLAVIGELVDAARRGGRVNSRPPVVADLPVARMPSPEQWDAQLAQAVTGIDLGATVVDDEPGLAVMRRLVDSGRRGRISTAARTTLRLLVVSLHDDELDAALDAYCRSTPPHPWGHDEGAAFLDWVERHLSVPIPRLCDAVALDRALMRVAVEGEPQALLLDGDPNELAAALALGREPLAAARPTLATIP